MKTNLVCKHAMKLLFSYSQAFSVGAINNQDDNLLHLEEDYTSCKGYKIDI